MAGFLAVLGAILGAGCDRAVPVGEGAAALALNLHRAGRVEIAAPEACAAAARGAAERWSGPGLEVRPRLMATLPGRDGRVARVVVGSPDSPEAAALAGFLGIAVEGRRLEYLGRRFPLARVVLTATFADPQRRGLPVTLLFGGDAGRLAGALEELALSTRPFLRIAVDGRPALDVPLDPEGRPYAARSVDHPSEVSPQPFAPHLTDLTEARRRLLAQSGPPTSRWLLDAAAVDALDGWWGVGLEEWCARLARLPGRPDLALLLEDPPRAFRSPHLVVPLRAAFVRHLRASGVGLAELWSGALAGEGLLVHAVGFEEWLVALPDRTQDARRADHRRRFLAQAPLRGAALTSSGAAPAFGSAACGASLARLAGLGANAVSVVSYFSAETASLEDDLALAAAVAQARELGMATLLTPRLLASPSSVSWGERELSSSAQWRELFEVHEGFLLHHALLAQLAGADALCLGAGAPEIGRTLWNLETPEREEATAARAVKAEAWERLVPLARAAFDGALTYSAGGPNEIERCGLWPVLDFIGVTLAPPLDTAKRPWRLGRAETVERLASGPAHALEIAVALGRPVVVTQVGFRSTARARRGSARRRDGGPWDGAEQARLYDCLDEALRATESGSGAELFGGFFLWRWSTDQGAGGAGERGFTPQGKPAEALLPRLLGR